MTQRAFFFSTLAMGSRFVPTTIFMGRILRIGTLRSSSGVASWNVWLSRNESTSACMASRHDSRSWPTVERAALIVVGCSPFSFSISRNSMTVGSSESSELSVYCALHATSHAVGIPNPSGRVLLRVRVVVLAAASPAHSWTK